MAAPAAIRVLPQRLLTQAHAGGKSANLRRMPANAPPVLPIGLPLRLLARTAFAVAILAALAALISGPGNRLGWWDYRLAFLLLGWAALAGLGGALLAVAACVWSVRRHSTPLVALSVLGLLTGLLTFGLPFNLQWRTGDKAPVHDISTDTADPPRFVALAALRAGVPNGAEYGGPEVAEVQRNFYPDITPLTLAAPPEQAQLQCLQVARAMGWEIVANAPAERRIEATDTTVFFGFRDDIIIRITPAGPASRIDVRSASRVGRSDRGVNARRIREFYRLLSRLQPASG